MQLVQNGRGLFQRRAVVVGQTGVKRLAAAHERLRYLIDCEEIKLKDLAPKLCLSASTLSNYAQGIREPDYDTLRRIADYFGVSIDYLLGHEPSAVDDERQLLTCYRSFTPSQKRFLLDQAALIKRYKIRLDD